MDLLGEAQRNLRERLREEGLPDLVEEAASEMLCYGSMTTLCIPTMFILQCLVLFV